MSAWIKNNDHGGFEVWQSVGAAREHVGTFKRTSYAELFVHSLASHQALVDACKSLMPLVDDLWRHLGNSPECGKAIDQAKAALALAKGGDL